MHASKPINTLPRISGQTTLALTDLQTISNAAYFPAKPTLGVIPKQLFFARMRNRFKIMLLNKFVQQSNLNRKRRR
jgi:hypothetical protein